MAAYANCSDLGYPICWNRIVDSVPSAMLVVDGAGKILLANARAAELMGQSAGGLLGTDSRSVNLPVQELLALDGRIPDERGHELDLIVGAGSSIKIGLKVNRIPTPDTDPELYLVFFQDITPYARLKEERARLMKLATMHNVLPSMLHKLRNPLAGIETSIELMIEEATQANIKQDLRAILGEVGRMKLYYDEVGAIGKRLRCPTGFQLRTQCQETLRVLGALAAKAGVELIEELAELPQLPLEPVVVRSILSNLAMNALDACESGGTITARIFLDTGTFCIEVEDTGCGMSEEVRSQCTDLFFSTKRNGGGIGLTLCKAVCDDADAVLQIESEPGSGTLVRVVVPLTGQSLATIGRVHDNAPAV